MSKVWLTIFSCVVVIWLSGFSGCCFDGVRDGVYDLFPDIARERIDMYLKHRLESHIKVAEYEGFEGEEARRIGFRDAYNELQDLIKRPDGLVFLRFDIEHHVIEPSITAPAVSYGSIGTRFS